jgi:hypothetical protein
MKYHRVPIEIESPEQFSYDKGEECGGELACKSGLCPCCNGCFFPVRYNEFALRWSNIEDCY